MTDEKVTDLESERAKRNPGNYIYQCPDCSCGLMWVYLDGVIECANCEAMMVIGSQDEEA